MPNDPMDIAPEVMPAIDFHRAGRNNSSLEHFVDGLRGAFTRLLDI